jgi:sarcosine oxidase subunit gamma
MAEPALRIAPVALTAAVDLRGDGTDPTVAAAVEAVLAIPLPLAPCTTTARSGLACLWLGPDEWLIAGDAVAGADLAASLERALEGRHVAVTDVSDNWTVTALGGAHARDVLAKGCPIDFHPRAASPGFVAQTLVAQADTIVHLVSDKAGGSLFHLYVRRSFAAYLRDWLADAALEYAAEQVIPVP